MVFLVCQEESLFVTSVVSGLWSGDGQNFVDVRGVMVGKVSNACEGNCSLQLLAESKRSW